MERTDTHPEEIPMTTVERCETKGFNDFCNEQPYDKTWDLRDTYG